MISATTGVLTEPWTHPEGKAEVTLDNVNFGRSGVAIADTSDTTILAGGSTLVSWASGVIFNNANPNGLQLQGGAISPVCSRPTGVLGGPNGGFFERSKPQYQTIPATSFTNALTAGCKGRCTLEIIIGAATDIFFQGTALQMTQHA